MYIPKQFKEEDKAAIAELICEFGFATLVSVNHQLPWATHIPLELEIRESEWFLTGHVARANPQWKNFETQPHVLAIFMGPHTYVSPSWYNHPNVPTWNYMAAHLSGKLRLISDVELDQSLRKLMARYENAHAEKPQGYHEIPAKTLEVDLRGVVGFEIKVEKIEAAYKLSQNRDAESYASVIEHLKKLNAYHAGRIAEEMEKRSK
jgi:transcriptional regulator